MHKNHLYKGSLTHIILYMLENNGEMYGYEISKRAKELTSGDLDITEGALYPTLHKLEAQGFLRSRIRNIGNRNRKYYQITPKGGKEGKLKLAELKEYVQNLHQFLNLQLRKE